MTTMTALTEHSVTDMEQRHVTDVAELENIIFSSPWSEKSLAECVGGKNTLFLVCEKDGRTVGYVGCYTVCDDAAITNVAVHPDHRRQGIAKALVKALISRASERGCAQVSLEVRVSNASAIALYEKLGFRSVGIRRGFYSKPREDALIMIYEI